MCRQVTTRSLRIKSQFTKIVIQDLPVFHMSYCGTDNEHPEVGRGRGKGKGRGRGKGLLQFLQNTLVWLSQSSSADGYVLCQHRVTLAHYLHASSLPPLPSSHSSILPYLYSPPSSQVFTFVAKEVDSGHFYCYVFRCTHAEKANALALSLAKAFYLAYQILLSEQGHFHEVPPRDSVFEPQTEEDTRMPPSRPDIAAILTQAERDSELRRNGDAGGLGAMEQVDVPRVARASESESLSSHISSESLDDDFVRLAKARSNPDILRSTLQAHEIASVSFDALRVHADPSSVNPSPATSPASLRKP